MPKHTNEELRAHLFDTLVKVKNGEMSTAEARSVVEVANSIISSARLEIDLAKTIQSKEPPTDFFEISMADVPDSQLPKKLTDGRELPERFKPTVRPGERGSSSLLTPPSLNIIQATPNHQGPQLRATRTANGSA